MASADQKTKLPPKTSIPRPSAEEFKSSVNKIHRKIDELKAQLNALSEKIQKEGENELNKVAREEQKKLREDMEKMQTLMKQKSQERETIMKSIRDIDKQKIEMRKKQKEFEKHSATTAPDLDAQIRKLELDLETMPGISLKQESKIMQDIKKLQHYKKNLKVKEEVSFDLTALDDKRKAQLEQVETLQREIEECRASKTSIYQQLQENSEKQSGLKESLALLRQEKQTLNCEISKHYDEIRVLREKFSEEMNEWKRKAEEEREKEAQRRQAAEKARQERQQLIQKERQAKEEEKQKAQKELERLRRLNPHEEEIVTCDILVHYLTNNHTTREKQRPVQFNANAFAKEGMQQFKRSAGDEDAWLFGDRGKKKTVKKPASQSNNNTSSSSSAAPQRPESQEEETVVSSCSSAATPKPKAATKPDKLLAAMPVAKLQVFDKLGIQPPLRQSEVAACVEELKKKKAHFESFKRTMEQVIEEEKQQQEARERKMKEDAERQRLQHEHEEAVAAAKADEEQEEVEVEVEVEKAASDAVQEANENETSDLTPNPEPPNQEQVQETLFQKSCAELEEPSHVAPAEPLQVEEFP